MQDTDYNVIVGSALPAAAQEKVNNESETDKTVCTLLEVIGQISISLHCVMCTYRGDLTHRKCTLELMLHTSCRDTASSCNKTT